MSEQPQGMTKALSTALKMEKDGMSFYQEASEKIKNPLGKQMFLSFVEDERRHYTMIGAVAKGLNIEDELKAAGPAERIRTVFEEAKNEIDTRLKAETSDVEAIRVALGLEDAGYKFYKENAEKAEEPREKALWEKLAHEESQHHEILQNALGYLEETGDWFLWEEGGPIEG
jgi:rubrerythrin